MGDVLAAWEDAVGPEIARNAWPARFQRDGTLIVHCQDAIWAFELGSRAAEWAAGIEDETLRELVARAAAASLAWQRG